MKLHVTIAADDPRIDTEFMAQKIADVVNHTVGRMLRETVFVIGIRPGYGWHHPDTCRSGKVEVLVEVVPARVLADDVKVALELIELGVGNDLKPDEVAAIERLRAACTRPDVTGGT